MQKRKESAAVMMICDYLHLKKVALLRNLGLFPVKKAVNLSFHVDSWLVYADYSR